MVINYSGIWTSKKCFHLSTACPAPPYCISTGAWSNLPHCQHYHNPEGIHILSILVIPLFTITKSQVRRRSRISSIIYKNKWIGELLSSSSNIMHNGKIKKNSFWSHFRMARNTSAELRCEFFMPFITIKIVFMFVNCYWTFTYFAAIKYSTCHNATATVIAIGQLSLQPMWSYSQCAMSIERDYSRWGNNYYITVPGVLPYFVSANRCCTGIQWLHDVHFHCCCFSCYGEGVEVQGLRNWNIGITVPQSNVLLLAQNGLNAYRPTMAVLCILHWFYLLLFQSLMWQ